MRCNCTEWISAEDDGTLNCLSRIDWMYCPFCGDELTED